MPAETKRARRGKGEGSIGQQQADGTQRSASASTVTGSDRRKRVIYGESKKEVQDQTP